MTDTHLDGLLDELVRAEPDERWSDVLGRARRSRRRYTAVAAGIAVLVLAPATWAAVDAFEGTPAPESIHQTFLQGDAAAAVMQAYANKNGLVRDFPRADPTKAHGVLQLQTSDGLLDMWAAPELDGSGSCWFIGWESDMRADRAGGLGGCMQAGQDVIAPGTYNDASHPAYTLLNGYVTGSEKTLDVTLEDGSTTTIPVVEHLFLAALPHGSGLPASIVGRDAAGTVVATWAPSG
jgi:hypothetical protein